jgi:hypothetical protein
MKFLDFFNPLDIDHLTAYQHLQKKGTWPVKFIPDDVEFETTWQLLLQGKMADLWVGTNIFMHDMRPSEKPDGLINLDRLFEIADDFKKKRSKNG